MTLHRAGCYATISGRELLFRIVPRSKADEKVTTPLLRNVFFHQKITSQTFFSLENRVEEKTIRGHAIVPLQPLTPILK